MRSAALALALALSTSVGSGFNVAPPLRAPVATLSSTVLYRGLMSPEEADDLMQNARDCEEGECSIDDVDDLIGELLEQQTLLYNRVKTLKTEIKTLEALNEGDGRNVDEVQETVRAIVRIFQMGAAASGNDYPALTRPTGYSGDVGSGPTTAYDALEPKQIKKD